MSSISFQGEPIQTLGQLPPTYTKALDFQLIASDLSIKSLSDYENTTLVLNIFPSIDTDVCASSVRYFNEKAGEFENTEVLCISRDLPFAQNRFCNAEKIKNVSLLSDYDIGQFGIDYGVIIQDGALQGLFARSIIIINPEGKVVYTQLVNEVTDSPNYEEAIEALKKL